MYFPLSRAFGAAGNETKVGNTTVDADDKYGQRSKRDMSAGELYLSFENTLTE